MMVGTYQMGGLVKEPKNVSKPKGLDAFQATIYSALQWIIKNQKALAAVTLPVFLVLAGGFAWSFYAAKHKEQRQDELAKIDILWQEEAKAMETKRQSMQKLIDVMPDAKDKNAKATTSSQQRKNIENEMATLRPDHAASLARYKEFYTLHQANAEGWAAGLRVASEAIKGGQYEEAETILSGILAKSVSKPFYQVQGRILLIALHESKSDYAKAIEVADLALQIADKELAPLLLLTKGRLQWLNNAKPEALVTLDTIIKEHGSSPEADKARGLRAIL